MSGLKAEAGSLREGRGASSLTRDLSRNAKLVACSFLITIALLVAAGFALSGGRSEGGSSDNALAAGQNNRTSEPQLDIPAGVNLSASGEGAFANISKRTTLAQDSGSNANQIQNVLPSPNVGISSVTNGTSTSSGLSNTSLGNQTSSSNGTSTGAGNGSDASRSTNNTNVTANSANGTSPSEVASSTVPNGIQLEGIVFDPFESYLTR